MEGISAEETSVQKTKDQAFLVNGKTSDVTEYSMIENKQKFSVVRIKELFEIDQCGQCGRRKEVRTHTMKVQRWSQKKFEI